MSKNSGACRGNDWQEYSVQCENPIKIATTLVDCLSIRALGCRDVDLYERDPSLHHWNPHHMVAERLHCKTPKHAWPFGYLQYSSQVHERNKFVCLHVAAIEGTVWWLVIWTSHPQPIRIVLAPALSSGWSDHKHPVRSARNLASNSQQVDLLEWQHAALWSIATGVRP